MQAASDAGAALSLLTPIGYQSGDCGYCKAEDSGRRNPDSRASYYATSKSLAPEHYQELMDRGWRRSGTLLYLPDASRSCCPHYTIRLPASQFQASRDQRQTLNRWNRFILGEKHMKQAKIAYPKSKEQKKSETSVFNLCTTVHESETKSIPADIDPLPDHRFKVTLEPDTSTEEKYVLFHDYQQHVHHEKPGEISRTGFQRFLCGSPLQRQSGTSGKKLGSYHHCYRLDGRLIAMSVLDLLPHAVSGVYFIYHHDFEKWSLGKLSALREAAFALENGYEYYYMGYYIHSCLKMRYKGTYKPQYVLDFEALSWDPLDDEMRRLMEKRKWVSMSRERQQKTLQTANSATGTDASPDTKGECSTTSAKTTSNSNDELDISPYPQPLHPIPAEAASAGISLLSLGMPGVLTPAELYSQVDLSSMRVTLGRGGLHQMEDIVSWNQGDELNPTSIKGIVAEMAACLGSRLAKGVIVDFGRGG